MPFCRPSSVRCFPDDAAAAAGYMSDRAADPGRSLAHPDGRTNNGSRMNGLGHLSAAACRATHGDADVRGNACFADSTGHVVEL